jgi:uncharacterized protein YceH (UPF0502 family)
MPSVAFPIDIREPTLENGQLEQKTMDPGSSRMSETSARTGPPTLSPRERRVLGVLVEKAKTTPDIYPLSLNALVTGCNQKSNRDPVISLTEEEVEETLGPLQQRSLVTRITGSRVEKWRHNLYEEWQVNKVELAVLAELLLRGPQTEGELRGRAARMEPIADLDALRSVLRPMAERGLIVFLGPEGRRGTLMTHGFHSAEELEALKEAPRVEAVHEHVATQRTAAAHEIEALRVELASVREALGQVQASVAQLAEQVQKLKATPPE